ncbi:hypothetical protein [Lolliginicoccus suaedae]|uniref:hypothetical protein n=1 Tax=Lolliginicoccus suaedae TaxID=2605429 RepID=UPI001F1BCAD1|nr:hypothetical protein [Lolliginicoccus suaedae]
MHLDRRRFLALIATLPAGAVAGCAAGGSFLTDQGSPAPTLAGRQPADGLATLAPPPRPLSAGASHWIPGPGEVSPEIKRTAAAFIETAGSWGPGGSSTESLAAAGASPGATESAAALHVEDARESTVAVVYPQYGGLSGDQAAVITLFSQHLALPQEATTRQLALDVRVRRRGALWEVERINPLTTLGTPVGILSGPSLAVLSEPRITLSGPSLVDIRSGRMHDPLLNVLLGLAREYTFSVQVMHTGHIQTVFPTNRVSNHAVGRAVDIREINGIKVVSPEMEAGLVEVFMRRAASLGATEVGGPIDLNGTRKGFFSDDVHRDHIHIGITPGLPRAHLR